MISSIWYSALKELETRKRMSFEEFQGFLSARGLPGRHTAEEMGSLKIIERAPDETGEYRSYRLGPKGPEAIEQFEIRMQELDLAKSADERARNAEKDSAVAKRQARVSNIIAFASLLASIIIPILLDYLIP